MRASIRSAASATKLDAIAGALATATGGGGTAGGAIAAVGATTGSARGTAHDTPMLLAPIPKTDAMTTWLSFTIDLPREGAYARRARAICEGVRAAKIRGVVAALLRSNGAARARVGAVRGGLWARADRRRAGRARAAGRRTRACARAAR